MPLFDLQSKYKPTGDQPQAIEALVNGLEKKKRYQTLLGVTGSGKTFTMANVIAQAERPALILCHNKTLAAQLYGEMKNYFPNNRVNYFISYYDYYQPESYMVASDTFIEKSTLVNEKIEEFRLASAADLVSRRDVIIISSVSCIYGFGRPDTFKMGSFTIKVGEKVKRQDLMLQMVQAGFERNDTELKSGKFRAKGDTIELIQGFGKSIYRVEMFGNEIEKITERHLITQKEITKLGELTVFPRSPYWVDPKDIKPAMKDIKDELDERLKQLPQLEGHRLKQRTMYDLELIKEFGTCKGIENYSKHFDRREAGERPKTLLDFFPDDFLMFIDESHASIPQVGGMYKGDRSRKETLVEHGFRLPSAFDNRPMKFDEFETYMKSTIFVSATPNVFELQKSPFVVEQIIRPTGLLDPPIEVRKPEGQIEDLLQEIKEVISRDNRVLITTLTKRMSEDLADFLAKKGIKVRYLHSEIDTIERTVILRDLRIGKFDCLVGINLLREGLDIPEVELVAILDADKEGFLRNERSLVQTIGRAARNVRGRVIMYASKTTDSMKCAIKETNRRRAIQEAHNTKHGIEPQSIIKEISERLSTSDDIKKTYKGIDNVHDLLVELEGAMKISAENLDFERAIELRDEVAEVRKKNNLPEDDLL
jgi:excinuclease ABC subunit B